MFFNLVVYFIFGAVLGSFAGALTYRWPREESIVDGRSRCPKCKSPIRAYDNIPIFSYLFLKGKCRDCGKPISRRYFFIELGLATLFSVFAYLDLASSTNLTLLFITYCIFIVDFEFQYIPDTLTFLGLFFALTNILTQNLSPYPFLLSGLSAGVFLLIIHLVTFGKGMGLGDVKLALFMGTFLGFPFSLTWMFLSFIVGSMVGVLLLIFRLKKFRQRIAFGPFLVVSFYLTLLFGQQITAIIFPNIWF